jgi:hypothetical protein
MRAAERRCGRIAVLACRAVSNRPRSRLRTLGLVALLLGLAVAAERGRWFARLLGAASPAHVWIWVAASPREVTPRAFVLARDFELATVPETARLAVGGDPEYLVRLNGVRVGSGIYRPGAPIDVYPVGGMLREGRNRLQLELRSPIGSGGATLRLTAAEDRLLAASDGEWRVYKGIRRVLRDLDTPLPKAPRVAVLGASPIARWGLPAERERLVFRDEIVAGAARRAGVWRPARSGEAWRQLRGRARRLRAAGDLVEVDFGRETTGYLHLDLDPRRVAEGMLFFSATPGPELDREPDRVVVAVPNLGYWQDAEAARFRYVTLVGLPSLESVAVIPLRAEAAARWSERGPVPGVLGLPMEPARSPLVEALRRRLLLAGEGAS